MKPSPSSARCEDCKSNPCLNGKPVTGKNFVDGAYFQGMSLNSSMEHVDTYGFLHIGDFEEYRGWQYQGKWIQCFSEDREFTEIFTENIKSLRYMCVVKKNYT